MTDKLLKAMHETAKGLHKAGTLDAMTMQKWEQGQKNPNGPSLKLLNLVDEHGLEALA